MGTLSAGSTWEQTLFTEAGLSRTGNGEMPADQDIYGNRPTINKAGWTGPNYPIPEQEMSFVCMNKSRPGGKK